MSKKADKAAEKFLFDYLKNASPTGFEAPGQKIWLAQPTKKRGRMIAMRHQKIVKAKVLTNRGVKEQIKRKHYSLLLNFLTRSSIHTEPSTELSSRKRILQTRFTVANRVRALATRS